jgi:AhpD family alkylhydroperoxidase
MRRDEDFEMTPRLDNPFKLAPDLYQALIALEMRIAESGLEKSLIHLVKIRVSQINGCAHCLHMHNTEARKHGETEMRLYLLSAWRESSLYSARERAALGWAEALTKIADTRAPDEDYAALQAQFTPAEQVALSFAIGSINAWNRLVVGFRIAHAADADRVAA